MRPSPGAHVQHPIKPYAISLAALVAAVLLRALLDPLPADTMPLVTMYGAVAVAGGTEDQDQRCAELALASYD